MDDILDIAGTVGVTVVCLLTFFYGLFRVREAIIQDAKDVEDIDWEP